MAWAYNQLGWISLAEIAQAHRDAAKELDVDVAPAGLAWQAASKQRPGMDFYGRANLNTLKPSGNVCRTISSLRLA